MYLTLKKGNSIQAAHFNSAQGTLCVAIKMAYQGGAYSAIVAMPELEISPPTAGKQITLQNGEDYVASLTSCREALISRLRGTGAGAGSNSKGGDTGEVLHWETLGSPTMESIKIYLPRFEIEFGTSLSTALKNAGLGAIFQPGDFTGISPEGGVLSVSDVVHKVYVKVDEMGTEAAAATAVMMMKSMARPSQELFVKFDRPFVFTIVHDETGLALFSGEVYKPDEYKEE